jgi:hypothetical protein
VSGIGRSVRLFLVEGTANGIITAEIVNWTGHVLMAPRAKLHDVLARSEAQRTGIYFLFGEIAEIGGKQPVYIGESDNVGRRLIQHSRNDERDFERFCIVTSKDLNLTKAHARYLENKLTILAKSSERAEVLNSLEPALSILPESDVADMEYFIEQVRLILPVLGFDILREKFVPPAQIGQQVIHEPDTQIPIVPLVLRQSRKGLVAKAVERQGEIVVLKGSLAEINPDFAVNQYQPLRDKLLSEGTLVPTADQSFLVFTKDTLFSSPSAAAAVIYGRNANGRTSWLVGETKQPLKTYQDEKEAAE